MRAIGIFNIRLASYPSAPKRVGYFDDGTDPNISTGLTRAIWAHISVPSPLYYLMVWYCIICFCSVKFNARLPSFVSYISTARSASHGILELRFDRAATPPKCQPQIPRPSPHSKHGSCYCSTERLKARNTARPK